MQKLVVFLCLAVLAGCSSSRHTTGGTGTADESAPGWEQASVAGRGIARAGQPHRGDGSIAALPDRGELIAYRKDVGAPHTRAYSWYPVDISEEHALRAIGGELVLPAPDGQQLRLRYERHIEHPDGNWTWVGKPDGAAPGVQAIITFGDKAVFGSIPYGSNPPLRLTTGRGRVWMLETDGRAVATLPGANPKSSDALLPPNRAAIHASAAQGSALRTTASATAQAASASAPRLDLLIGYTSTFASRLGGQSQANTRLTYLVDVANLALSNSRVDAQVRLVKTMQVSYPDATGNADALYALTGCTETSCTQVDPALQPLHDARDRYGADVVSLVRNFNDPENGGCGIAWLIGGGQVSIQPADDYAAMSVVSDSNGMGGASFPDNGYVCRDETLAHEIGHNLGSAHDRTTAAGDDGVLAEDDYGRYPYSFGYKTTAGNFFTVMAYGDSGQTSYRVFSNPRITFCGGHACGTTNDDNARSLTQTFPEIAKFRADASRKRMDFNGDGRSDVFWRNVDIGYNTIWLSANSSTGQAVTGVGSSWRIEGFGDFDGDGRSDVFWRSPSTGTNVIWKAANSGSIQSVKQLVGTPWRVAGVADFNGDGRDDVLWRHSDIGYNTIWLSADSTTGQAVAGVGLPWIVAGVGDFDGDGRADILWRNPSTGTNVIWRAGNSSSQQAVTKLAGVSWEVAAVADFNADGRADIFWRNADIGYNTIWLSGSSATGQVVTGVGTAWTAASVADYDGDGRADIFWRNPSTGVNVIWKGANSSTTQAVKQLIGASWQSVD